MKNETTNTEIYRELIQRGEKNIRINPENGLIYSTHGKHTHNTWIIKDNELKCIECYTKY